MTTDGPAGSAAPPPGRPGTLGTAIDTGDAADLLAVLLAVRSHHDRGGGNAYKVAREALWFMWEQRRLPRPLIRGKYPVSYPWSPSARRLLQEHRASGRPDGAFGGVVIEHLVPATLMVQEALAAAPDLDVGGTLELLNKHGAAAVVSAEDDKRLTSAGLRAAMPPGWNGDVWARARVAGLEPASFAPLVTPDDMTGPEERITRASTTAIGGQNTRTEFSWESYVTDAGHPPAKIALARALAEQVESLTGWSSARTAGQIVFRDRATRVLAIQLWLVDGVRIEADALAGPPPPDLFGPAPARRTNRGSWYWTVRDGPRSGPGITRLIELVRSSQG